MKAVLALLAVPLLAQQGVNLYSPEKERAIGEQYAAEIRKQSKPVANPLIDGYVARVGGELVSQLKDTRVDYRFEAISGGAWTEPFALPGGYVFVPADALVAAQDEAEFAGMLAHSIGHAALRHGTRMASRGKIVNMASIPLVFMGHWGGSHAESRRSEMLLPMSFLEFQRTYELEADRFGLELAARAGYDPAAYGRYVARAQRPDSDASPLPARELRLTRIRETVTSLPSPARSPSGDEFRRVQEAARPIPTLRR